MRTHAFAPLVLWCSGALVLWCSVFDQFQIRRYSPGKGSPGIAKNFEAIDANKDGKASKEEIKAYHQAKMQKMREKKGEKTKS